MTELNFGQESGTRPPVIIKAPNIENPERIEHSTFWQGVKSTWINDNIEACLETIDELLKQQKQ